MNQPKKPAPFKNKNFIIVLIMLLMLFVMFPMTGKDSSKDITRTEFLAMMGDSTKVITELTLQKTPDGVIIEGAYEMSPEEIAEAKKGQSALARFTRNSTDTKNKHFKSHMLEISNEQISTWEAFKGVKVKVIHESTTWIDTLVAFLPAILLIAFFYIMMSRQMGGGGKSPFSFGKSQVRQLNSQKKTTFNDVAGCDEAKQDLQELVEFFRWPSGYG